MYTPANAVPMRSSLDHYVRTVSPLVTRLKMSTTKFTTGTDKFKIMMASEVDAITDNVIAGNTIS